MPTRFLRIVLLFLVVFNLFSCTRNAPRSVNKKKSILKAPISTKKAIPSNIRNIETNFPQDTIYPAYILTAGGVFHVDEVDPKLVKFSWQGLFKADSGYYIAPTTIKISKDYDAVLDEEGQKTGWNVTHSVKDTAILLISSISQLQHGRIDSIGLHSDHLLPGEQQQFIYKNVKYTLYATGIKKIERPGSDAYQVSNYKLFIRAVINGHKYDQLLVSVSNFDDALTRILFVGDMDGDGIPDFIIDTTADYNEEIPTLYLSSPAEKGALLKVMGMHPTVGC